MKRLGIVIVILLAMLLSGCGVSQEDYGAVIEEKNKLSADVELLQTELTQTSNKLKNAEASLQASESNLTVAQNQLEDIKEKLISVQNDLSVSNEDLLNIQNKYPLRYFNDKYELGQWLSEQTKIPEGANVLHWYISALILQDEAMKDGYILNTLLDWEDPVATATAVTKDKKLYFINLQDMDLDEIADVDIIENWAIPSIKLPW